MNSEVVIVCRSPDGFPQIARRFPEEVDATNSDYITTVGATDTELDRSTLLPAPTQRSSPPSSASAPTTSTNNKRPRLFPAGARAPEQN
eukprot:4392292-Amphidinium_carterae.1